MTCLTGWYRIFNHSSLLWLASRNGLALRAAKVLRCLVFEGQAGPNSQLDSQTYSLVSKSLKKSVGSRTFGGGEGCSNA